MALLRIEEVAFSCEVSVQTINNWYKFKRENPDDELAKILPEYSRIGSHGERFWSDTDIEALREFKTRMPKGRKGKMGSVTQRYVNHKKAFEDKNEKQYAGAINNTLNKKDFEDDKIEKLLNIYSDMVSDVEELEQMFPDRHFTLDGHLIGSIGEVIGADRYGVILEKASHKDFDGTVNGFPVQIKMVQQNNVSIHYSENDAPYSAFLIVLYLNKNGSFFEVYNGKFSIVWNAISQSDGHGNKRIGINKLMELDSAPNNILKLKSDPQVPQMENRYKNTK